MWSPLHSVVDWGKEKSSEGKSGGGKCTVILRKSGFLIVVY